MREITLDETLQLSEETRADDVAWWDSHNHIRLLLYLAGEFAFTLKTSDIEAPSTVGALIDFILAKSTNTGI